MQLEGIGVTQPDKHGPFQLRLKFGKQAYCVVELRRGEEATEIAKKLCELAAQVEASSDVRSLRTLEQEAADRGAARD